MTKRDFELIAAVLANLPEMRVDPDTVAEEFADALATTNPRFDRTKFLTACGHSEFRIAEIGQ
jgi:hypothetical protein